MPTPELLFCFRSNKIESHPCANCRAPMMNVRFNLARLDSDQRTFECFNCDKVDCKSVHRQGSSSARSPVAE
jgi:hypothetical protein